MYKKQVAKKFKLSDAQLHLLEKLVYFQSQKKLYAPIVPMPAGARGYIIYVRGEDSLEFANLEDLDVLVGCGFLSSKFNRMGNGRLYYMENRGQIINDELFLLPDSFNQQQQQRWAQLRRRFIDVGRILEFSLSKILEAEILGDAVADLSEVKRQIDLNEPNPEQIREHIQRMGQLIMCGFDAWSVSAETADVLAIFSEWSSLAVELINLEQVQNVST